MAVNPQVLKLISMLVPQRGTSSLTRRALARGLTRDKPVPLEDLVELIARRNKRSHSSVYPRDPNFKEAYNKGFRFETPLGRREKTIEGFGGYGPKIKPEEFKAMTPEQRKAIFAESRRLFESAPLYDYRGSVSDFKTLNELRRALAELLS